MPGHVITWRTSKLLFGALSAFVIVIAITLDRNLLTDQQNYLDAFAQANAFESLAQLLEKRPGLISLTSQIFGDEILWQLWATGLRAVVDPGTAVVISVATLNIMLSAAIARLEAPNRALIIWVALSVGFCVIGLIQIRQGFAFALMMFFMLRLKRPILGASLAAMVHTTFVLAAIFCCVDRLFRSRREVALAAAVAISFLGAYFGRLIFEVFGGRRLLIYTGNEGATSINYVLAGLICIVPSIYWLIRECPKSSALPLDRSLSSLVIVHVGVTAFTVFSTFMFPLGAGRVGYLTLLLLIPIVASIRPRRIEAFLVLTLIGAFLVYQTAKSYSEGAYAVLARIW